MAAKGIFCLGLLAAFLDLATSIPYHQGQSHQDGVSHALNTPSPPSPPSPPASSWGPPDHPSPPANYSMGPPSNSMDLPNPPANHWGPPSPPTNSWGPPGHPGPPANAMGHPSRPANYWGTSSPPVNAWYTKPFELPTCKCINPFLGTHNGYR